MKAFAISLTLFLSVTAYGQLIKATGTFKEPTETYSVAYREASVCGADQGDWDSEMELCFFKVENTVKVEKDEAGNFTMAVDTFGANTHTCYFEGPVTRLEDMALISEVPTEVYDFDAQDFVPATCEVKVTFEDQDTVSVDNNGNCQEFCGARASLYLGPAARQ